MKSNISKLSQLNFPIFGRKEKPYKIMYSTSKITCYTEKNGHVNTVDDISIPGDYFNRLLHIEPRLKFDVTCRHVQDIISSKIKWGMDSKGTPIDFSTLVRAEAAKKKIIKLQDKLLWVDKIAYPFEIPLSENISVIDEIYAILVKINGVWVLRELTYERGSLLKPYIMV